MEFLSMILQSVQSGLARNVIRINTRTVRTIVSTWTSGSIIFKGSCAVSRMKLLFSKTYCHNLIVQHTNNNSAMIWNPISVFECPVDCKYAIIILNCPIYWKDNVLLKIWEKAQVKLTVDGGTHRWLDYLKEQGIDALSSKQMEYVPDFISGDMDSLSPTIVQQMKERGSEIFETPDQNYTDYTKALYQLSQYIQTHKIDINRIYVFADTSGRFDQIIGNINTLYKAEQFLSDIQVIQIANDSLTWLLRPGSHKILIPDILLQKNSWCGLLPFGSPVHSISTTGLKWNLNNSRLQFGELISTSNTYKCSEVTVSTDTYVVWTMDIEPLKECTRNNLSGSSL